MKRLTIIQHTSADYLGLMEDHFEGRGIGFGYCRPFTEGSAAPKIEAIGDALVLLGGGPWGSAGERNAPTLREEVTLARYCLMAGKPIIGIGLGAQILAIAADGGSSPHPLVFEPGYAQRCDDKALNGFLPERIPHVIYMRDRPEPPAYARVLARDALGRPAIFQIGERAFGFAAHPGFKLAMAEDLIMEFEEAPTEPTAALEAMRGMKREMEVTLIGIMTGLIQTTGLMDP